MNCRKHLCFLILATILVGTLPILAGNQWTPKQGFPIRQGWHIEWFRAGEGRDVGQNLNEAAITWSDCRNGDRGVFTQILDVNGNLKFSENGLKVADSTGRQEDPGVWPDIDGGWFFAWEDFDRWVDDQGTVHGDTLGDIYCTKIDAEGQRLWGDERGVPVCVVPGIQENVRIVHDGQGGCIIAWLDKRGGDPNNIYAMHITAHGEPDPGWSLNGNVVVAAAGEQASHTADVDGVGGMIIGWKDGREVGNSDIWAQRILADGTLFWGNGEGILVCSNGANQDSPKLCPDGRGGAFFTWVDDRNRQQTNKDIYAQRVDANGNLMWGAANEGVPLCTAEQEQVENRIIITEPGTAIVLWQDKRANGQEYDIYAQRINGEGQMVKTWQPEQGRPVAVAARNQQEARMYPDGQGGAFFAWEDERDAGYPEIDIWAQRLNVNGAPQWAENGIPVCRVANTQQAPLLRRTAEGGAFIAWQDQRSGSFHLYGQKLRPNGTSAWTENGIPLAAGLSQNATNQQLIPRYNGPNTFAVVWSDGRYGVRGSIPFIQLCVDNFQEAKVETLLHQDGIPMIAANVIGGAINPRAFAAGNGEIITVWQDQRQGQNHSIYIQKTNSDGEMVWGPSGIRVAEFPYDQALPYACTDGDGGAIIAWKAPTNDDYFDIYLQRIDHAGRRMWGEAGLLLTGNRVDEFVEGIVSDDQGGAVVVWIGQNRDTDDDLYIQRVDADGHRMWSEGGGLTLSMDRNKQHYSVIAKHPEGFVVAWLDGRDEDSGQSQDDIYAQFIEPDGTMHYRQNGAGIFTDEYFHQLAPTIAVDTEGYIWLAWEDNRHSDGAQQKDIYCQKFTAAAQQDNPNYPNYMFDLNGKAVCTALSDQAVPDISSDMRGGVWITWEDYRSGVWSDVYCTHLQSSGDPYPPFHGNGNLVCDATHKQNGPVIDVIRDDGNTGAVLLWEDKRATGKEELSNAFVQRVDDFIFSAPRISEPSLPRGYKLESVYPNPFNEQAVVCFVTIGGELTRLALYDVNGRFVQEFASGRWDAGRHLVMLDGRNLAAGSYIVRMTVGESSVERAVQLLK